MAASTADADAEAAVAARGPGDANMLADMRGGARCLFRAADGRLRRMFSKPHGKLVRYNHQLWGFKAVGALRTKMGTRSDTRVFLRRKADLHGRLEPEVPGRRVYCDSTGKKLSFDRVWRGFWDQARNWRMGQNDRSARSTHSAAVRDDIRVAARPDANASEMYYYPEGARPEWLSARFHSEFNALGSGAQLTGVDVPEEPDGLVDEGFELAGTISIVEPVPPPRSGSLLADAAVQQRMAEPSALPPMRPTAEARLMDVGMARPMLEPAHPASLPYQPTSPMHRPTSPTYRPTSPMHSPTAAAPASDGGWEEYHLDAHGVPHSGPAPAARKREREGEGVEAELCSICLDTPRSHVFTPCGHMTACGACAVRFRKQPCPICRTKVQATVKLFKA